MQLMPITVECYAGHKADERPSRFCREGQWIEVAEVTDQWYQAAGNPEWPMADYFKVLGDDARNYLLKHDRESDEWFLAHRW